MNKSRLYRVNKFLGQRIFGRKCPEIRWNDVVRIEAFGTDVFPPFVIMITFYYNDGSKIHIQPEEKGYHKIIESLDERFPSISPNWFVEMQAAYEGWRDVHRVLYSSQNKNCSK